jgi:MFS family permease
MLKRLTPRVFFTGIILLWGLIMTLMGLVKNYPALLACRFLLGLAEAGLFPGKMILFHLCKIVILTLTKA